MLAIRLPAEVEDRLDALAKATGRTKTYYAREAILAYLEDLEDTYLAEKRLEESSCRSYQGDSPGRCHEGLWSGSLRSIPRPGRNWTISIPPLRDVS